MSILMTQTLNGVQNRQNQPPHFRRLRTKLALSFMALTVLVTVVLTLALYINIRNYLRHSTQQYMIGFVSIAALQVNADENAALTDPGQENSAEYLQIKHILQQIRDSSRDIRNIYTVRYSNNQKIFIVDAESDPALVSHLVDNDTDALPSTLSMMANNTQPYIEPEINSDQWGTWITSCAPLFMSTGERGDFLCIDMSVGDRVNQEHRFLWVALALLGGMLPFVSVIGWWIGDQLAAPLTTLIAGAERVAEGNLQYRVNVSTRDETAILAQSINSMVDRLNKMIETLEQKVDERAREVERRSNYLTAAAEVGRVANSILDADQLLQQVIELVQKQFDLYYVGLFLLSEDGKWAVLRAGTGEAGQKMIARQHRIQLSEGMIGWCIANAQPRVANEVYQDFIRLEIPELPETRSEAALPLLTRGRIIGALSVQSERSKAFDDTATMALQTMADLVAVALDNARLFTESREIGSRAQNEYVENQSDWENILSNRVISGYYADKDHITPLDEHSPALDLTRLEAQNILHLPIRVRGQVLGTIHARKVDTAGVWNPEETALLGTLTDQLSIALENARLYRDTQRSAEREHIISDITAKVRASANVNVILQTAVRELAEALRVSKATVQLHVDSDRDSTDGQKTPDHRSNGGNSHA